MGCGAPDLDFLDAPPPAPISKRQAALALSRTGPFEFQLPPMNRPNDEAAPDEFPFVGEFSRFKKTDEVTLYRIDLPVAVHLLPQPSGGTHLIGGAEPEGFEVIGPDGPVKWHFPRARAVNTWGFDHLYLYLGLAHDAPAPRAADYRVRFPRATEAENGRNFAVSGLSPDAFVRRGVTVSQTSRHGLFLPAPARATFPLTVPANGRLTLKGTILAPAIHHATQSDGATLHVRLREGDTVTPLGELPLSVDQTVPGTFDLSAFATRDVDLILETVPGPTRSFDYVFLEAPVVAEADRKPRRILALFIDTLRPDHLGFMGYERETSPVLDRMAQHAAVFTQARSVAPWTLPSARAALSGHQPERWQDVTTLAEQLGTAGFRTEGFVTNAFLSPPFEMQRGFDRYRYRHLRSASNVVSEVEDLVEEYADRDLFVLAHFMEPHLPYDEPWRYRFRWAGLRPRGLHYYSRPSLINVRPDHENFANIRQHLIDRYDQNIVAVDAAIGRALEAVGPDATVIVFSDHGEEFWDHDGFEHGHTFYDEVLRVPFVIRGPSMPVGRFDHPVSLLDLTPTVLDLVDVSFDDTQGRSLVPLATNPAAEANAFAARPHAFGRPLYDGDGWGSLVNGEKWWNRSGVQARFELEPDPGETTNVVKKNDDQRFVPVMAEALGTEVEQVWRFVFEAARAWPHDLVVTVSHPQGIREAELAYAPRVEVPVPPPKIKNGRVIFKLPARTPAPEAMYVRPNGPATSIEGLALSIVSKDLVTSANVTFPLRSRPPEKRQQFLRLGKPAFQIAVDLAWIPKSQGQAVEGFSSDMTSQLKELGYVDP